MREWMGRARGLELYMYEWRRVGAGGAWRVGPALGREEDISRSGCCNKHTSHASLSLCSLFLSMKFPSLSPQNPCASCADLALCLTLNPCFSAAAILQFCTLDDRLALPCTTSIVCLSLSARVAHVHNTQ